MACAGPGPGSHEVGHCRNLPRILKRRPDVDVDEAEIDELRVRVLARLAAANRSAADGELTAEEEAGAMSPVDDDARAGAPVRPAVAEAPSPWLLVAPLDEAIEGSEASAEPPLADRPPVPIAVSPAPYPAEPTAIETAVAIEARQPAHPPSTAPMARRPAPGGTESPVIEAWPSAQPGFFELDENPHLASPVAADPAVIEAPSSPQTGFLAPDETPVAEDLAPGALVAEAQIAAELPVIEAGPPAEVVDADEPEAVEPEAVEVAPRNRRAKRPARAVAATSVASSPPAPVEATVYCPSCASLLQPPPEATRRCPRCHQRIVVRHIGARPVYLAEAVVSVFEAERRRAMEAERERDRWLDLARESGADADQVPHRDTEIVSEADVAAARALYMSTVDRSFRIARSERRWAEAAGLRYDQASSCSASPALRPHRRRRSSSSTARAPRRICRRSARSPRTPSFMASRAARRARPTKAGSSGSPGSSAHRGCPIEAARTGCAAAAGSSRRATRSTSASSCAARPRCDDASPLPPMERRRMTRPLRPSDCRHPSASRATRGRMTEAAAIESRAAPRLECRSPERE